MKRRRQYEGLLGGTFYFTYANGNRAIFDDARVVCRVYLHLEKNNREYKVALEWGKIWQHIKVLERVKKSKGAIKGRMQLSRSMLNILQGW